MPLTSGLGRRAPRFATNRIARATASLRALARRQLGKSSRALLLVGALPVVLTTAVLGWIHLSGESRHGSAPSRHVGRLTGPADWWAASVRDVGPIALFLGRSTHRDAGTCGGATNGADRYIGRESNGDPGAVNPVSGAYGCYQITPGTWTLRCSDLGPEPGSIASTQAQCASRLPVSSWGG